ncbi:HAD family hydrolase [Sulfobacillus harzensis]|uniref:HAD family hydrolase n=1 Tax=Sulfobacillus harzensis TaxID=2729629 RepID=A0A7Y0L6T1_9FIRM|nr:HAD family hydrolase [Sulfobacillus harzensis]NMP24374.1 HAD family hydrolase [Sulfobacillus harzensis]
MLKAVLFDLDGTLLDIDGDAFLEDYMAQLARYLHPWVDADAFVQALWSAAAGALAAAHPQKTNRAALMDALGESLGVSPAELSRRIDAFSLSEAAKILPGGRPMPGSRRAVAAAQARGLKIAVATTPIYHSAVVHNRLDRAQLDDVNWDVIATDQFFSTKPYPAYFLEVAERLGVSPESCLMVGDNPFDDMAARTIGMATYYTGRPMGSLNVGRSGTLLQLAEELTEYDGVNMSEEPQSPEE